MNRCMPFPLGVICLLDNRSHERHGDGPEVTRAVCHVHDGVMVWWWRLAPWSTHRFDRKHLGVS